MKLLIKKNNGPVMNSQLRHKSSSNKTCEKLKFIEVSFFSSTIH